MKRRILDSLMLIVTEGERVIKVGLQFTLLNRDIVVAFNQGKQDVVLRILVDNDKQDVGNV